MASTILIKRSTGTTVPSSLEFGELAVTVGAGTQVNRGDRVFVGDNNTTVQVIGGKYFTDMLDHVHGILTANSGVITDSNSKVNRFRVDDVNIDANVVETDTTDTDLIFRANGTGKLVIEDEQELEFGTTGDIELKFDSAANVLRLDRVGVNTPEFRLDDDLKIQFGSDGDAGIRYDATQLNVVRVDGADWQFDNGVAIQINDVTNATNRTTGAVKIAGGLGVDQTAWIKDLVVDDNATIGQTNADILTVNSTVTFKSAVTFEGTNTYTGTTNLTGQLNVDNIRIDGNTISTTAGSQIILDPDPAGGDASGDLIIRGNLQVSGTTTTVNSTQVSINDPVFNIGDAFTEKTVVTSAATNDTVLEIDNPSGVNTGSLVTGSNIGTGGRTIDAITVTFRTVSGFGVAPTVGDDVSVDGIVIGTFVSQTSTSVVVSVSSATSLRESSYYQGKDLVSGVETAELAEDSTRKSVFALTRITLNSGISGDIIPGTILSITQGSNDGMDRGIQYSFHNGSAIKQGFFGYDRTGGQDGLGAFTFFEDALNTNNVFTANGNKGTVVIGDLELDTDLEVQFGGTGRSTFTTNGIIYGNTADGLLVTAAANMSAPGTGTDVATSYQVLTVTAAGVPVWTDTIDGGTFT